MRIAIAKKQLSTVGGSEIQARLLAHALAGRGHNVTLVGMRPPWRRPGLPGEAVAGTRRAVRVADGGVLIVLVPSRFGRAGAACDALLPFDLADGRVLAEALRGVEIVHCIAREWARSLVRAARRGGAAYVETPLVHPGQPFAGAGPGDIARYRRADAVIALTEWEAAWYRARGARQVHVTGIGPATGPVAGIEPEPATILFVGRKERYKGYHALRDAARIVWRSRPEARFVAIGQRAWRDRIEPRPRDPRWIELGVVDERTKAEAYARATVLAMPSEHETFGHTYLEAWTFGRPVIAGDIPPLREVVREGIDGLHSKNEPGAIARAILRMLGDPDAARRMGEAGRARVAERFTWARIAELTEDVYRAAIHIR